MKKLSRKDKIAYIKARGWSTLYNDNYWVHYEVMKGANLDYCGANLDEAYKIAIKRDK